MDRETLAVTREQAHRAFAMHIRNRVQIRFTPPADDAGPAHQRDGDAWLVRLSPSEADMCARAAVAALEDLGVISRQNPTHAQLAERVSHALTEAGHVEMDGADFGWRRHLPVASGAHLLVTCEPSEALGALPSQAVRQAVAQNLAAYVVTLTACGLGVVAWGRTAQDEVLIIAADQESADRQAPNIIDYLTAGRPGVTTGVA